MKQKLILEIAVESVSAAQAAERGGADRIELCPALGCGGLTPSAGMMQQTRESLQIPIYAMIRPRAGNFCYSEEEFSAMRNSIRLALAIEIRRRGAGSAAR